MSEDLQKKNKYDSFVVGCVIGLVLPLIVLAMLLRSSTSFVDGYKSLMGNFNLYVKYLTLALIPNSVAFFIFYKKEMWFAAKGVIFMTLIYFISLFISEL